MAKDSRLILVNFLDKFGLELSTDPYKNRKYFGELLVVYTFLALTLYLGATLLAPLLIKSGNDLLRGFAAVTYIVNIYMCHQLPERSYLLFGEPLPLCERCIAIFLGAFLAYPSASIRKNFPPFMQSWWFVVAALIPIGVDGVTQLLGMRESNSFERFATGFISAFAVMYFLIATILEKYSTGKTFFRKGVAIPVSIPFAFLVLPLLIATVYVGSNYQSADSILLKTMQLTPNATYYEVRYISPHAIDGIPIDPYLSRYSDPILQDVDKYPVFRPHGFGVWASLALNSTPEKYGNYVYLSKGNGDYYYYDAWTGALILKTRH